MSSGRRTWLIAAVITVTGLGFVTAVAADDIGKAVGIQIVLPYSAFKAQVKADNVRSVTTSGGTLEGETRKPVQEPGSTTVSTSFTTRLPSFGDPTLEAALESDKAQINPGRASFTWDVAATASPLSTLAAVLAGFVLIAIVAILTFPPSGPIPKHDPLHPLLTAFLTLVVASFLFAVLAGGGVTGGSQLAPLAQGYAVSWILAFGVLQTAVGLAWLLRDYGVADDVIGAARLLVQVAVVILAASLSGILVQPLYVLSPANASRNLTIWVASAAVPLLAAVLGTRLYRHAPAPHHQASVPDKHLLLLKRLTPVALTLVVAAVLSYGVLSSMPEEAIRHDSFRIVFACLAAGQAVFALLIVSYEMTLPTVSTRVAPTRPPGDAAYTRSDPY